MKLPQANPEVVSFGRAIVATRMLEGDELEREMCKVKLNPTRLYEIVMSKRKSFVGSLDLPRLLPAEIV